MTDGMAVEALDGVERAAAPGGRWKRYPAYKDAGVEWLGEIPAGWQIMRLKNCVRKLESGGTPESDNPAYWTDDESGTPWVAISDMTRDFHVRETSKRLAEAGLRSKRLPVLPVGTLLYSMYASLGKVALLEIDAVVNQAILGLMAREEVASRQYLRWWLEFMQDHVQMLSSSNTQDNLSADKVRNMPVFLPRLGTQSAIAAFLDHETARIDALVAKKDRLIELLQEKRSALITRAVTKGLDSTVPMKDSGVEWLGEIPVHWEVMKLAWLTECLDGRRVPLNAEERGTMQGVYPYWGANSIVDYVDQWLFDEELVLLGEDGAPFFDRLKPVAFRVMGKIWVNNHAHVLRARPAVNATFLAHVLNCVDYRAFIDGTTRDKLTQGDMNAIPIQCPPVSDQRAISAFLDRETARIDALISKVQEAIHRLKELRTALISAAVTGKIDVREEAA